MKVKISKINQEITLPEFATVGSAGMDLKSSSKEDIVINSGEVKLVPTGISIALPDGYEAQIRPRSGLAFKNGITVLNAPGTIDSDYRGEIKVMLINHSNQPFIVSYEMRIAQMVISKYEKIQWAEVKSLDNTDRGEGGFGSTGTN
jgi:dUTP pyrophosphatase